MIYIALWFITVVTSPPCPDYVPNPYYQPACVYNQKTIVEQFRKDFDTKEERDAFVAKAPEGTVFILTQWPTIKK